MEKKPNEVTQGIRNFYHKLAARLNGEGDRARTMAEPRPMLEFQGGMDKRPLVKNLGNWIEKEGFLFFDSMVIPHPAGFIAEKGLYDYTTAMQAQFTNVQHIEALLDVAIRELAAIANNPEVIEARSFRLPDMSKLDNGATVTTSSAIYAEYFDDNKSKDRDVLTKLFKNANDLNRTAIEVERLIEQADSKVIDRFNDKAARLTAIAIDINLELVENADRQRKDVVADIRDKIISPLAEWCEVVSIYFYQVNVLKVCFSDIEEHIQRIKK